MDLLCVQTALAMPVPPMGPELFSLAMARARRHLMAELRLVCTLPDPEPETPTLRLCS
ncbi:MAG: hypothetical protein JJD92_08340 [Frankiaceae bacterium]|nr:hypothetical protein [Frankiaceae bacterium]